MLLAGLLLVAPLVCGTVLHLPLVQAPRHRNAPAIVARDGTNLTFSLERGNPNPNHYYYTQINIGTPPQALNVAIEMGSPYIAVASTSCSSGCPANVSLYDISKDTPDREFGTTVVVNGVNVTGNMITDTIDFGPFGSTDGNFLQVIEGNDWIGSPVSGTMGFGGAIADVPGSLWYSLLTSQSNMEAEFSFWLARPPVNGSGDFAPGGSFFFGGVNTALYSGSVEFLGTLDSTTGTSWTLPLQSFSVQQSPIAITNTTNVAHIEMMNPGIGAPAEYAAAFWAQVSNSSAYPGRNGFYQYPCSSRIAASISFGGTTWNVPASDINLGKTAVNATTCIGAVYNYTSTTTQYNWVVGIPFLRNVYSVFRPTVNQIGFAQLSTLAGGDATAAGIQPASVSGGGAKSKTNVGAIVGGILAGSIVLGLFLWFRCRGICINTRQRRSKRRLVSVDSEQSKTRASGKSGEKGKQRIPSPRRRDPAPPRIPMVLPLVDTSMTATTVLSTQGEYSPTKAHPLVDEYEAEPSSSYSPGYPRTASVSPPPAGIDPRWAAGPPSDEKKSPGDDDDDEERFSRPNSDPVLVSEVQNLRAEVKRLQNTVEGPPPTYFHAS